MGRLLIVANRLPVTAVASEAGTIELEASTGGLATGLAGVHESSETLWIGWLGNTEPVDKQALETELTTRRLVPVELDAEQVRRFYHGFSNGVIWPLFHYLPERLPLEIEDFAAYRDANERFADTVAAVYEPDDLVWVHDYQLLLVPSLLRDRLPKARIGFFLHIPFPSSEVLRTLPYREELLQGMLGADLIGFHTAAYLRHFATSVLRVLGVTREVDRVTWRGREVRLGAFPMGVDAAGFTTVAASPEVDELVRTWRQDDTRVLLGVDRLDYTKGILRRLIAFERLLQHHPDLRERVRLVQIAVPSREDVQAYQSFREQAEALIGRIHGAFATPSWVPVHWMYRGISREELVALYRSADVMLVTPLRDGMNLVAKEFCASRIDDDGVLVLSEFAGAASELAEALPVNPYDVEEAATVYYRALTMPPDERRLRMHAMRRRVLAYDAERWAQSFLSALTAAPRQQHVTRTPSTEAEVAVVADRIRRAPTVRLLLDYDGTLVPFALSPDLARPDAPLLELLTALAKRPGWEVHVSSGRGREVLERWLGSVPIGLHAEHGLWSRAPGADAWSGGPPVDMAWRGAVTPILIDFAMQTPGSLIEEKEASIAWHYRAADAEFGPRQAMELHAHLTELLSNLPLQILPGDKVIEIRPFGVDKGKVVAALRDAAPPGTLLVAMGDDRTDDDMFRAVAEDGIAIQVGARGTRAPYRLPDVAAARTFLRRLLEL
jgi:trehalose 6-phosphate synthase/phosphatase